MKATSEAAFEALIEEHLLANGYCSRSDTEFDPDLGLLASDLLDFIEESQPKVWAKQRRIHREALEGTLIDGFQKAVADADLLRVLRHGFKFYGSLIRVAYFRPAHGLNPDIEKLYQLNRVTVARQVHHDPKRPLDSLDLVLFVNGIPVVTAELKNAMTQQKASHAMRQYRQDRDPDAPIFRFKRGAVVHFAVGSDEAWMTTRLAGPSTYFLPFNKGNGTAAGNPLPVGDKHRTHYLWEQVWERHSLLDILARFAHLQVEHKQRADGTTVRRETMIFPRYHQLDVVRKLIAACRVDGAGTNYLVQHSAGSGKSNSIAWLAHRLASLHDDQDRKVYNGVIVLTDRRVLDQQLQDTIYQFDHKQGVVRKIEEGKVKSTQLAQALKDNAPIIICTLHSFGYVADKLDELPDRRYAVLVDEAHSSQGGDMAKAVRDIIGIPDEEDEEDEDDSGESESDRRARWSAERRRLPPNMSYFAFTATPKFKTLCLFGTQVGTNPTTKRPIYEPFHLYSMRQAIDEGFILDVLRGYTTYKTYFKLVKAVSDDPELDKKKASKALARFVSLHPSNIAQKTKIVVEHFRQCVMPLLGGHAKAMVVTGSRLHAVRYKLALDKYIREQAYRDVRTLVAFSGSVTDPNDPSSKADPYTEPEMNAHPVTRVPLKESELPQAFDGDDYNVLVVANKYQTGFDQPRLCAMYVDKRLSGIQAVQTLSRLNRRHTGKTDTFVLDFRNKREDIQKSFQTFYEGTTVLESVDPQRLYELQSQLDAAQVYRKEEVDRFARFFFKPAKKQRPSDNASMNAALNPAVDRFGGLEDDAADEFRSKLGAFVRLYGFLAQIVPFSDVDLEKLYVFLKMLQRKLPTDGTGPVDVDDDVALDALRQQKQIEADIRLQTDGVQPVSGPVESGTGTQDNETEKLSTLIEAINERFKTDFDAQDLLNGVMQQLLSDEAVQQAAAANDRRNFAFVGGPKLEGALVDRHSKHGQFIDKVFDDPEVLDFLKRHLLDDVYGRLKKGA